MEIQTITCGMANAYLVCGQEGSILIDTGTSSYREKVLRSCRAHAVRLILLTHGHVDHCQNAADLSKALNCPVCISAKDAPLLTEGQVRPVSGTGLWGRLYAGASNRTIRHNPIPSIQPEVLLEDGMSLLPYGVDGKVVALPGHTAGSVGVVLSTGELFVGDAMQSILCPAVTWCYENREEAERSAAHIRQLDASRIYYGHGKPTP